MPALFPRAFDLANELIDIFRLFLAAAAGAVLLLLLRACWDGFWDRRNARIIARAEERFGLKIMETAITPPDLQQKPALPSWAKEPFRRLILQKLFRHSGSARRNLAFSYETMGYAADDLKLLKNPRAEKRLEAVAVLGLMGNNEYVSAISAMLDDGDEPTVLAAARALSRLGDDGLLDKLPRLASRLSLTAGRRLLETADVYGEKLAAPARIMLENENELKIKIFAVDLIGKAKIAAACSRLFDLAKSGEREMRVHVARALGSFPTAESEKILLELIDDDQWEVRAQAARSLTATRSPAALKRLAAGLCDAGFWVRYNCARGLVRSGNLGRRILEEAREWPDRFARDIARQALETAELILAEEEERY
jgi:hypothetical protein